MVRPCSSTMWQDYYLNGHKKTSRCAIVGNTLDNNINHRLEGEVHRSATLRGVRPRYRCLAHNARLPLYELIMKRFSQYVSNNSSLDSLAFSLMLSNGASRNNNIRMVIYQKRYYADIKSDAAVSIKSLNLKSHMNSR